MSRINQVISGRYVIKELIGQGGMADVYLAQDTILERVVAIKLLRSSLTGDPVNITRFHREASAAATLNHKNIVQIYDVGEEDDLYYIVMEYVPGQTLKDLIRKRGALHYVEAIDIMKQVVSATAKAHSMGIIHRDLKPQNVLVTDSGVVKIADFGIASIQSLTQVTQSDTIMGSLHYLAPEIARGEKATIQSDIYALGIVFYELMVGDVPFNGESPVNIALKHMRDEIPSVRDYNPTIPQSVENIIIKATAKNTKDRYESANDMYEDLCTCLTRQDEEKLVFDTGPAEPTIVAEDTIFADKDEKEDTKKDKKKKNNRRLYIIGGSIIAGIIVIVAVFAVLFSNSASVFSMPNVVGLAKEDALEILDEKELIYDESEFKEELSPEYEEGIVISSDPVFDSSVHKGDSVVLTISSGKYIVIDDFVGSSYDDARLVLEDLGFEVTKREVESDDKIGQVIEQSIPPTQEYDPHSALEITLTVSKGIEISVPNVYGETIDNAKTLLESSDYGFKVSLEVLDPPTDEAEIAAMKINVVYKQSVAAYTKMTKTSNMKITLYYYDRIPEIKKEEEETEPESKQETEVPIDDTQEDSGNEETGE